METQLRAAVISWLESAPDLSGLNAIEEESPLKASPPWLGIAASASTDWSTKDRDGREVRIALELVTRGDETDGDAAFVKAITERITTLPADQSTFTIVNARFMRARSERRRNNLRASLLEFRIHILSNDTE